MTKRKSPAKEKRITHNGKTLQESTFSKRDRLMLSEKTKGLESEDERRNIIDVDQEI